MPCPAHDDDHVDDDDVVVDDDDVAMTVDYRSDCISNRNVDCPCCVQCY
jgi:hypothetical protein